jgi:hypothetical protein
MIYKFLGRHGSAVLLTSAVSLCRGQERTIRIHASSKPRARHENGLAPPSDRGERGLRCDQASDVSCGGWCQSTTAPPSPQPGTSGHLAGRAGHDERIQDKCSIRVEIGKADGRASTLDGGLPSAGTATSVGHPLGVSGSWAANQALSELRDLPLCDTPTLSDLGSGLLSLSLSVCFILT